MAVEPVLMRDVTVEVGDGLGAFLNIDGIQGGVTHTPNTTTANASTFASAGRNRNLPVGRGDTYSVQALRMEDQVTGARNPGQARCEYLYTQIGQASLEQFRLIYPGGGTLTFQGHCEVADLGGGVDDLSEWSATIEVYGNVTRTNPGG